MSSSKHNVIWTTPSQDAAGSMPLGNGSLGINLWVEPRGDLCFYLSRTDSWGEFGQLYKVGRVRVRLSDADGRPLLQGDRFHWELKLEEGAATVSTDRGWVRVWVDANRPVIQILAESETAFTGTISTEIWRTQARELTAAAERHGLHVSAPYPVSHEKDTLVQEKGDRIVWVHQNRESTWSNSLRQQGLDSLLETQKDPLLHRCFGGLIQGNGLEKVSDVELRSASPSTRFEASVLSHCTQCADPADWIAAIQSLAATVPPASNLPCWQDHVAWWRAFWERSWIDADGCEAARKVSQGYALQRYMNACAGRGTFPIKFNGSIFTVDWNYDGERFDADYRRWGPGYWHQNTRLPYWSMLYSGDFEMMRPYFEMYRQALPLATERIRKHCGHAGAAFTETMWFWGAYLEHNYGWPASESENIPDPLRRDPELPGHLSQNQYIRLHNSSGLEVVYHGLLFYRYTSDDVFLSETLLPIAEAVIDYYDQHFERKDGKLSISPAQVIEQWRSAVNPLPEVAGLHACLSELLSLPDPYCPRREAWQRLQKELPEIPRGEKDGRPVFHPAESWEGPPQNSENPELYAVFPYHRCHLESETLQAGIDTFLTRTHRHDIGWAQDGMQAALLGLEGAARESVVKRLTTPSAYARFPAFWGPGFDWIPDQDQGGSAAHALQLMLMQCHGDDVYLLPAWPDHWPVRFKLAGPYHTRIFCEKKAGQSPVWEIKGKHAERLNIRLQDATDD